MAVNLSFERYRPVATGSVLAAGGLGIMLMPLLCRFLLDAYGWRHTLGALCTLSAQLVVAGALLFPPSAGERRQPSRRLGNRSEASVQTSLSLSLSPRRDTDTDTQRNIYADRHRNIYADRHT